MSTTRRIMLAAAAGGAALGASQAAAQIWPFRRRQDDPQPIPAQHEGHAGHDAHADHMQHMDHAPDPGFTAEEAEVIHALTHCDMTGQVCLTHCLDLLAQGDASMAACARSVREMLTVCASTRTLMQSRSTLVAAQLAVCRDACAACRAACQPHVEHHEQCRACAESCAHAVTAIDVLLA